MRSKSCMDIWSINVNQSLLGVLKERRIVVKWIRVVWCSGDNGIGYSVEGSWNPPASISSYPPNGGMSMKSQSPSLSQSLPFTNTCSPGRVLALVSEAFTYSPG